MTKQVLSATALALLIGVSTFSLNTALAQNGGDARSNDREMQKKLDDRELTPVRPIRRVGEENWPTAKDQPASGETTGQSAKKEEKKEEPAKDAAKQDAKKEPSKQDSKQDTAQNTAKPDAKQQTLGNQAPPPDKPDAKKEAKQETPKQDTKAKTDTAKQEPAKQEPAKQDTAKSDTKPDANPAAKPQDTAKTDDKSDDKKSDKGFASIRLGTDERGRVAVNEAQEKQITKVIRKQHVDTVNVKVSVGSVAPANVRVVAVSSDMVDVLPQFRGYSYFATREEIVIVEPSSKKVVALIPMTLTATASRPSEERTTSTDTQRTEPQRGETRTTARPSTRERDVTVGRAPRMDDVPSREAILAAPVARGPAGTTVTRTYRSYQYEPADEVVVIERRRPRLFPFW